MGVVAFLADTQEAQVNLVATARAAAINSSNSASLAATTAVAKAAAAGVASLRGEARVEEARAKKAVARMTKVPIDATLVARRTWPPPRGHRRRHGARGSPPRGPGRPHREGHRRRGPGGGGGGGEGGEQGKGGNVSSINYSSSKRKRK